MVIGGGGGGNLYLTYNYPDAVLDRIPDIDLNEDIIIASYPKTGKALFAHKIYKIPVCRVHRKRNRLLSCGPTCTCGFRNYTLVNKRKVYFGSLEDIAVFLLQPKL